MADNVAITPGTGDVVAAEDIGGSKFQKVKLIDASSTSTAGTGVAANPFVVSLNTTAVTVSNIPHTIVDSGNINIASATLGTVTISGTVSLSSTKVTIETGSAIPVSLSSTKVTIDNTVNVQGTGTAGTAGTSVITVQGIANMTAVKVDGSGVTQPVSGTVSLSSTSVTVNNGTSINVNVATATLGTVTISGNVNVASATLGTVTITGTTVVTSGNINVSSATLGTVTISGSITNSVSTISILSRTYTGSSGTASASGNNTIFAAGTNKTKVYAFSLTTTATTPTTCILQSGAGGNELWRVLLQAPSGANAGANLAVSPPAFLFATASATLLNLNLSAANAVHYSFACFDEA